MIRERLVHIHYDDTVVQGKDSDQAIAFFNALGKISSYGFTKPSSNGAVDYISVSIDDEGNIAAGFYEPNDTVEDLRKSTLLWKTLSNFQHQEPSILNAQIEAGGNDYLFESK